MENRHEGQSRYCFSGFSLDLERGALSRGGTDLHLRPKSFEVLRYLVQHPGRLVGKQELMDAVWGRAVVTEGSLTQCIIDIRRAIGDDQQRMIRTVPRRGFIFETPVQDPSPVGRDGPSPEAPHAGAPPASDNTAGAGPAASRIRPRRWQPVVGALAVLALVPAVAVWWPDRDRTSAPQATLEGAPRAAGSSVAVLRFLDLSPAGDQAWFADGLAEELLNLLAQSPDLQVTARGSSFAFEPTNADIALVAERLGVSHVVEGSVRRDGDALRITVQLIDAQTQAHIWSRTYDRTLARVLDLQSEIAGDIAATLAATLARPRNSTWPQAGAAQESYLLGRHLFHRRGAGDLAAAERHFQRAVELDPRHARAWAALAGTYQARTSDEFKDRTYQLEEQRAALERALAIEPTLAEAQVRLGRYFAVRGDAAAAQEAFERAFQLAPGDPLVIASSAHEALLQGRLEAAVELTRRIVTLDPLSAVYRRNLGSLLLAAGQPEEALRELRRAQTLSATIPAVSADIATALLLLGRGDDARPVIAGTPPGPRLDQLLVLLESQPHAGAAEARLRAAGSAQHHFLLGEIAAYRGDAGAAFGSLEAARDSVVAAGLRADFDLAAAAAASPFLGPLRGDPRWATLLSDLRRR